MKELLIALFICVTCLGQPIPKDKVLHFTSCYIISATSTQLLLKKYPKPKAAWIGFGIGATVGISKEIYDMRCGHSDEKDLFVDILGAAAGTLVVRIRF